MIKMSAEGAQWETWLTQHGVSAEREVPYSGMETRGAARRIHLGASDPSNWKTVALILLKSLLSFLINVTRTWSAL